VGSNDEQRSTPSADEIREAERMIRRELHAERDLDDLVQEVLAEALSKWNGTAKFSTYVVALARQRAKDRAATRARETLLEDDATLANGVSPWRTPAEPSAKPTLAIARVVERFVSREAHNLEGTLPGPDGSKQTAGYLRVMLGLFLHDHGKALQDFTSRGMPLRIPDDFEERLSAHVRKVADTGSGHWVESADTTPVRRRGRPSERVPATPAYAWRKRREDMHRAIVRYALSLCGLSGADWNKLNAPIRRDEVADRAKWARMLRSAKVRLGARRKTEAQQQAPHVCEWCGGALAAEERPTCAACLRSVVEGGAAAPPDWPRDDGVLHEAKNEKPDK
jgi:hypothetical protein